MDSIDNTIKFLTEALVDEPDNLDLRFRLASAFAQKGTAEKAVKQCELILAAEPDHKGALTLLETLSGKTPAHVQEEKPSHIIDQNTSIEQTKITFKDVGGMEELKNEVRMSIIYPFEKPELYEKYGKKAGGGILLYGPPGCGKTYLARATAGEIKAMFLSVAIDDVLNMWHGESEKNLHNLFQTAREVKPTVMFFDEVDALGIDRLKTQTASSTLVNQLLVEMDGVNSNNDKLLIIGATNTPWQIDHAFHRPGRFDKIIFVPPPDELARAEIFKIHLADKPVESIDYMKLAKHTHLYSGADIAKVVDIAVENIMKEIMSGKPEREITMKDLMEAIKSVPATTKEWFATAKNFAKYANESGNYNAVLEFVRNNNL